MEPATFIHMPRTGGITTSQHLLKCGLIKQGKNQRPGFTLTAEQKLGQVIGIIREPVRWYPSVYNMSQVQSRTGLTFQQWLPKFMDEPSECRTCCWGRIPCPPCPEQLGAFTYYHILYFTENPSEVLRLFAAAGDLWQMREFYREQLLVNYWLRTWKLEEDLTRLTRLKPERRLNQTIEQFNVEDWYTPNLFDRVNTMDGLVMKMYDTWPGGAVL